MKFPKRSTFISRLRDFYENINLTLSTLEFKGAIPLRVISKLDLSEIWSDKSILKEWEEDQKIFNKISIEDYSGGVNSGDRRAIFYLIRHIKPKTILEIGTHLGSSTLSLCQATLRNSISTSILLIME